MKAKTGKGAAKLTKKTAKKAGANPKSKLKYRNDLIQAARTALDYTMKDVEKKSGVTETIVRRIMQGMTGIGLESLMSVVASLHLEMVEVFDQEARLSDVIETIIRRAKLNWKVIVADGAIIVKKTDGKVIAVSSGQTAAGT
ncbi:MAG: helix-turn-helix domain-containing protein [Acidobacteria bacterium]|nr:helix-turn-helix domain-containing protein [Acidobacteriota bacterium]